ncbi:hypothetical protein [Plantibacter sp. M259]|nr:hypothetical protein [Plantibacter sp. M259]
MTRAPPLDGHVEGRRRLVRDEELRATGERDGDRDALPLPPDSSWG